MLVERVDRVRDRLRARLPPGEDQRVERGFDLARREMRADSIRERLHGQGRHHRDIARTVP